MRSERYRELLDPSVLNRTACTVIGVGAIGRQAALQLAAIGFTRVQLIDPDTVEAVNLGSQAYEAGDVGLAKVEATAAAMRRLNPDIDIEAVRGRFARSLRVHPVVLCCVDSIRDRRHIWSAVGDSVRLFIDARMAAEVLRVLTVADGHGAEAYRASLFSPESAYRAGCTSRSTLYCASIAAGWMVAQLARWLRGLPTDQDLTLNLLSSELGVG